MGTYFRAGSYPPVVFIAQLGTGGDSWKPVLDRLPGVAAFTYDRPGTGNAPGRPEPNPALPHSVFARELADLLEQHHLTRPAVVVGHSFGGNIAKVYAGQHPERIAGLVFVDSSIPQTFLHPNKEPTVDGDGPDATVVDTVRGQVDILTAELPRVPAAVLARTHGTWDGVNAPPHPAIEDLWRVSQQHLARQFKRPLIAGDNVSHQIPDEAPGLVAYAISAVVDAVRHGTDVALDPPRLAALGGHLDI